MIAMAHRVFAAFLNSEALIHNPQLLTGVDETMEYLFLMGVKSCLQQI
jgi:hypothetical protein